MTKTIPAADQDYILKLLLDNKASRVPRNASFELTHRCNLKCVHCYQGDQDEIRQHRQEELDTATVKRV